MTVAELLKRWKWQEMFRSPGRFALVERRPDLSVEELLGPGVPTEQVPTTGAGDTIVVARFEDGGLVSYHRADGSWVHTLNTRSNFQRKLWELGVETMPLAARFRESGE